MLPNLLLQIRNVSKSFAGVKALDEVSLDVEAGRVHVLMGENGAGKSTLMKILGGLHLPDAGEIRFNGQRLRLRSPHDALRVGIAMIHQELLPFRDLSVAANIAMGREATRWFPGWLDHAAMSREATTWNRKHTPTNTNADSTSIPNATSQTVMPTNPMAKMQNAERAAMNP